MPDTTPTPAIWSDTDPLMTAMAAAVYEQCDRHPEVAVTIDDPRTIAAVAATVARQVIGAPTVTHTAPPYEIERLQGEVLALRAERAELQDLLRAENARANAAIERESVTEQAELEARADRAADALRKRAESAEGERDCLAMAVMFALQWKPSAPMSLRDGVDEILATMPRRLADETQPTETEAHGHVWVTALDGDDHPMHDEHGRPVTHCGICGQRPATAATEEPQP